MSEPEQTENPGRRRRDHRLQEHPPGHPVGRIRSGHGPERRGGPEKGRGKALRPHHHRPDDAGDQRPGPAEAAEGAAVRRSTSSWSPGTPPSRRPSSRSSWGPLITCPSPSRRPIFAALVARAFKKAEGEDPGERARPPEPRIPSGYYYMLGHTWLKLEEKDRATVGVVPDFLKIVGIITQLDLPKVNDAITQGNVCGKISDADHLSTGSGLPASGRVIEVNTPADADSSLLRRDPLRPGLSLPHRDGPTSRRTSRGSSWPNSELAGRTMNRRTDGIRVPRRDDTGGRGALPSPGTRPPENSSISTRRKFGRETRKPFGTEFPTALLYDLDRPARKRQVILRPAGLRSWCL